MDDTNQSKLATFLKNWNYWSHISKNQTFGMAISDVLDHTSGPMFAQMQEADQKFIRRSNREVSLMVNYFNPSQKCDTSLFQSCLAQNPDIRDDQLFTCPCAVKADCTIRWNQISEERKIQIAGRLRADRVKLQQAFSQLEANSVRDLVILAEERQTEALNIMTSYTRNLR